MLIWPELLKRQARPSTAECSHPAHLLPSVEGSLIPGSKGDRRKAGGQVARNTSRLAVFLSSFPGGKQILRSGKPAKWPTGQLHQAVIQLLRRENTMLALIPCPQPEETQEEEEEVASLCKRFVLDM